MAMGSNDFRSARPHEPPRASRNARVVTYPSPSHSSSGSQNDADYRMGLQRNGASREYDRIDTRFSATTSAMAPEIRRQLDQRPSGNLVQDQISLLTASLTGGMHNRWSRSIVEHQISILTASLAEGMAIEEEEDDEPAVEQLGIIPEALENYQGNLDNDLEIGQEGRSVTNHPSVLLHAPEDDRGGLGFEMADARAQELDDVDEVQEHAHGDSQNQGRLVLFQTTIGVLLDGSLDEGLRMWDEEAYWTREEARRIHEEALEEASTTREESPRIHEEARTTRENARSRVRTGLS